MFLQQSARVLVLATVLGLFVVAPIASANSLEVDGPGFKVQNKTGWFGTRSTSYNDALGNGVNRSTGIFGRTSTKTSVMGTQLYKRGQNVSVTAPGGNPLVSTHRGWFGGRQTRVNGNNIVHSFKGLFNGNGGVPTTPSP